MADEATAAVAAATTATPAAPAPAAPVAAPPQPMTVPAVPAPAPAPIEAPAVVVEAAPAAPQPAAPHKESLEEYCQRKSKRTRQVELVSAFDFEMRAAGRLRDTEAAFDAAFAEFATRPVAR